MLHQLSLLQLQKGRKVFGVHSSVDCTACKNECNVLQGTVKSFVLVSSICIEAATLIVRVRLSFKVLSLKKGHFCCCWLVQKNRAKQSNNLILKITNDLFCVVEAPSGCKVHLLLLTKVSMPARNSVSLTFSGPSRKKKVTFYQRNELKP